MLKGFKKKWESLNKGPDDKKLLTVNINKEPPNIFTGTTSPISKGRNKVSFDANAKTPSSFESTDVWVNSLLQDRKMSTQSTDTLLGEIDSSITKQFNDMKLLNQKSPTSPNSSAISPTHISDIGSNFKTIQFKGDMEVRFSPGHTAKVCFCVLGDGKLVIYSQSSGREIISFPITAEIGIEPRPKSHSFILKVGARPPLFFQPNAILEMLKWVSKITIIALQKS